MIQLFGIPQMVVLFRFMRFTDDHLKNIIRHCKKYFCYPQQVIDFFEEVAKARGINETIDGDPIPWKDKDGKYKTYDPSIEVRKYAEVVPQ